MTVPADDGGRPGRQSVKLCSVACHVAAVLLAFGMVGCSTMEGMGLGWGEADPVDPPQASASHPTVLAPQPASAASAPTLMAAATSPGGTATALVPADDPAAEAPLPDDASAALRDLTRKAMAGDAHAEYQLGDAFARGTDVPRNDERAAYWYRRAADHGNALAAYALGGMFEQGVGVQRDAREAMNWYRKASVTGFPHGAFDVGRLYEAGQLGPPNPRIAAGWYRIAADAGDDQGREALARLQVARSAGTPATPGIATLSPQPNAGRLAPPPGSTAATSPVPVPDNRVTPGLVPVPEAAGPSQTAVASPANVPATNPAMAPERPATTAEIREIQQLLGMLDLDAGRPNGQLGRKTQAAIATFQQSQGLPVTGRPSPELLQALRTAAAPPRFD